MFKPRILICSDQQFICDAIYALLTAKESFHVVGKVYNHSPFSHAEFIEKTDVLLMVFTEQEEEDIIYNLITKYERSKILVVTPSLNQWFVNSLISFGVKGLFHTSENGQQLVLAILQLMNEGDYKSAVFQHDLKGKGILRSNNHIKNNHLSVQPAMDILEILTQRELQILRMLALGNNSSQIADELFISKLTVNTHRKHILKKTGMKSTTSLIRLTTELGIV